MVSRVVTARQHHHCHAPLHHTNFHDPSNFPATVRAEKRETTMSAESRLEALDRAVRVALSKGVPGDTTEEIVARAEEFNKFLTQT